MAIQKMNRKYLSKDVDTAAKDRISLIFDEFNNILLAFSGGKDSTVLLHLAAKEAKRRNRKFGCLFVDLEAQYKLTIDHVENLFEEYRESIIPYWITLPIILRNAVSVFQPKWLCWDPENKNNWVRNQPSHAINDLKEFSFFKKGMEFEEFIIEFSKWYQKINNEKLATLVGIRTEESLNRYRTITSSSKEKFKSLCWTTKLEENVYNVYPIYDWKTKDIWTYHAKYGGRYNLLYDRMHQAGVPFKNQRICQPYGDDQRRGLYLYQIIEPDTWTKVVARVNGANSGSLLSQEIGNSTGRTKITLPPNHTWKTFTKLLLETLPRQLSEHYKNKIAVFLKWWESNGYPSGIPDEMDSKLEVKKEVPSWKRICKSILRNDYWCKGLSFNQTKSYNYEKYLRIMANRRSEWKII